MKNKTKISTTISPEGSKGLAPEITQCGDEISIHLYGGDKAGAQWVFETLEKILLAWELDDAMQEAAASGVEHLRGGAGKADKEFDANQPSATLKPEDL